jgi:hypothetical protein
VSGGGTLFGLYRQLSVWSGIAAIAVLVWSCRSASGSLPCVQALPHHRGIGDQHRLRPAMSHSRQNNTRPDSRARLFRDRRSLSVPGLCLAGLSDDEAELRNDLGDGGLGGLKGNNLARTRSRNKQFGFA